MSFPLIGLVRSTLLTHFTAEPKGDCDCDTHFHASMINTEGRLFITLIPIPQ